jgi:hypothetical protein
MTARTVEQVEREQAQAYKSGDMPLAMTLHNERMAIAREAQRSLCACGKHSLTIACVGEITDHDGPVSTYHFAHQCTAITFASALGNAARKSSRVIARRVQS